MVQSVPPPGAFDHLLHPQETPLQAAKRQVWVTEERIDHLLTALLGDRRRMLTVDDPRTLDRLTRDLIVLESLRTLLRAQQTYVAMLEDDGPAP